MTNPESFQEIKETKWIPFEDQVFLNEPDSTFTDYSDISDHLDEVIVQIPYAENQIKMLDHFNEYYASLSDDEKEYFIVKLERIINRVDASDIQKGATMTFLSNLYRKGK